MTRPLSRTGRVAAAREIRRWLGLFQIFQRPLWQQDHPDWKASSLNVLKAARTELDELIAKMENL